MCLQVQTEEACTCSSSSKLLASLQMPIKELSLETRHGDITTSKREEVVTFSALRGSEHELNTDHGAARGSRGSHTHSPEIDGGLQSPSLTLTSLFPINTREAARRL
ncbi:unnamed protein product [Leuciscus chuanchicus]